MKSLEEVRENFKNKIRLNKNSKKLKNYSPRLYGIFTKLMLLLVIFLSFLIIIKGSPQYKKIITNKLFQENIPFMKINNLYTTYLGNLFPFSNMFLNTKPVFKEKLVYQDLSKYKDGVCLKVDKNYLVPVKESGIVIFIGEQEDYQKTVIIQEASGIEIWYGNLKDINVNIYDYVEQGTFLGEVKDETLYLVFKKDGQIIDYQKFF